MSCRTLASLLVAIASLVAPARAQVAGPGGAAGAGAITVSAAVSLKEALTDAAAAYERQTGRRVKLNFGATGHLLAQIRDGAPVDGFVSAAESHMRQAIRLKVVEASEPVTFARNALVLIVPADAKAPADGFRSLADGGVRRLAIGQPKTVPAGEYATQVLDRLGLSDRLRERLVFGSSVRQVLDYVQRGEVDAGIVYATDAQHAGDRVKRVATAEASWHDPILYSIAPVTRSARRAEVRQFGDYLTGDGGRAILARHGFEVPATPASTFRPASPTSPTSPPSPPAATAPGAMPPAMIAPAATAPAPAGAP